MQKNFAEVEKYYICDEKLDIIAGKIIAIVLKLYCYFNVEVYCSNYSEGIWLEQVNAEKLAELMLETIKGTGRFLNILLKEEETMISVEGAALGLSVYNPSETIQELLAVLSASEGLFFWKSN